MEVLLSDNGRSTYDLVVLVASEKGWADENRDLVLAEVAAGEYDAIGSYEYEVSWDNEQEVAEAVFDRLTALEVDEPNYDKILAYVAQLLGSTYREEQEIKDNSITAAAIETVYDVNNVADEVKSGVQAAWKPVAVLVGLWLARGFL